VYDVRAKGCGVRWVDSDTHTLLRHEALIALKGSDFIIHAGEVGAPQILEPLSALAWQWRLERTSIKARLIASTEAREPESQGNLSAWRISGMVEQVNVVLSADHDRRFVRRSRCGRSV
jgi:hypothetical protein